MQRNLLTILTLSIFLISSISVTSGEIIEDSESIIDITENNSFIKSKLESKRLPEQSPDIFTANLGQLDNDKVLFYTQNGMIWFTDDGVWMELREYGLRGQGSEASGQGDYNPMQKFEPPEQVLYNSLIIKQEFIGANKVIPEGRNQLEFYYNYFYGNDPSKWRANVPNFHEIYYENLYNGIDLRYYFNEHGLKYDFIVHPGADLSQIRIKYEGAQKLEITQSGELRIKTQLMDLIDGKLCIYQEDLLSRNIIKGKFVKLDDLEYSFELLGKYDPQKILVIDPLISLDFSTYVGGMDYNYATSVATYSAGYPYATGYTRSTDFPKTSGSYQPNNKGGYDAYILKFNLFGSTLLFGTFLGGTLNDYATDIVVDSSGNPIITGYTRSQNFPNTTGAYDPDYNSRYDAFVAKFNPSGNLLLYSTYLGGDEDEYAYGIAVDSNGNAYVTGSTKSSDYPTTSNAYDRFFYTDWEQVFISKLNNAGTNLLYSTFIAGYQFDCAYDIAVDSNNNMYVTGVTESWRYPTTDGAYDETHSGALERDMFVTKIHSGGSTLLYSTFVKGSSDDMGYDIALDSQNNAVVTGTSWSSDFPTTPGVVDNHNNYDGVIFKLNHNGSKLIFSTFLGGNDGESVNDVTLDSMDNVYLTGFTNSQDFPITPDAHDPIYALKQAFFTILSPNATNFLYSTYIGGTGEEVGYGIAISPNGEVYIVGETRSNNFYTSASAFDSTYGGTRDGFLQKYTISSEIKVKSIQLIKTHPTLGIIYSRLKPYTFEANITDTVSHFDLKYVKLILDPSGSDIQILWNRTSNNFSEINDPYDYVSLAPSMAVYHDLYYWSIDFNLTFNWTYPDENVNSVQVIAYSSIFRFIIYKRRG
jgi:hypothetical protein